MGLGDGEKRWGLGEECIKLGKNGNSMDRMKRERESGQGAEAGFGDLSECAEECGDGIEGD